MQVSFTELDTWRRCPQLHYYKYMLGWEKYPKAYQLDFGSLWHKVMAMGYTTHDFETAAKKVWVQEHSLALLEANAIGYDVDELKEKWDSMRKRLFKALEKYKPIELTGIWTEQSLSLPLTDGIMLVGTPDRKVLWRGDPWFLEFKTANEYSPQRYLMDDQSCLYCAMAPDVRGTIYDVLQTSNLTQKFLPMLRTEAQRQDALNRATWDALHIQAAVDHSAHPQWDCHMRCDFSEPCLMEREGKEVIWEDLQWYRPRKHRSEEVEL